MDTPTTQAQSALINARDHEVRAILARRASEDAFTSTGSARCAQIATMHASMATMYYAKAAAERVTP